MKEARVECQVPSYIVHDLGIRLCAGEVAWVPEDRARGSADLTEARRLRAVTVRFLERSRVTREALTTPAPQPRGPQPAPASVPTADLRRIVREEVRAALREYEGQPVAPEVLEAVRGAVAEALAEGAGSKGRRSGGSQPIGPRRVGEVGHLPHPDRGDQEADHTGTAPVLVVRPGLQGRAGPQHPGQVLLPRAALHEHHRQDLVREYRSSSRPTTSRAPSSPTSTSRRSRTSRASPWSGSGRTGGPSRTTAGPSRPEGHLLPGRGAGGGGDRRPHAAAPGVLRRPLLEVVDETPERIDPLHWRLRHGSFHEGSLRLWELPGNLEMTDGVNFTRTR